MLNAIRVNPHKREYISMTLSNKTIITCSSFLMIHGSGQFVCIPKTYLQKRIEDEDKARIQAELDELKRIVC